MKILITSASDFFTDHLPVSEGLISYEIVKRLAERGHALWVISPRIALKNRLPKNVLLYETGSHDIFSQDVIKIEAGRLKFAFQSFLISKKIIGKEKIDIVHHILPSDFGRFFDFVPLLKRPFVAGPAFLPWELPKNELLLSENQRTTAVGHLSLPYKATKRYLFEQTMKSCDALLISTKKLGKLYSGLIDKSKMHHVPIGVDTSVFRPSLSATGKKTTIFTSGHLHKRKGFDYLIRAMPGIIKEVPNAELAIAGDGIHRKYFESIVAELGLQKKVRFLGYLPRKKMVSRYQACSLFCLPSLSEPFGMVILEAMACGKPIVATNVGGIPEIVKNGILVPSRSPEALVRAVVGLLSDKKRLGRMGRQSRKTALKYDWERVVDRIEKIYRKSSLSTS